MRGTRTCGTLAIFSPSACNSVRCGGLKIYSPSNRTNLRVSDLHQTDNSLRVLGRRVAEKSRDASQVGAGSENVERLRHLSEKASKVTTLLSHLRSAVPLKQRSSVGSWLERGWVMVFGDFLIFSRANMIFLNAQKLRRPYAVPSIAQRFLGCLAIVVALCLTLSLRASAQTVQTQELQLGRLMGTVIDVNGDAVTGATVLLTGSDPNDHRAVVTAENGFFEFDAVKPGIPYQVSVSADGFAEWTSPTITLDSGQFRLLGDVQLRLATEHTSVEVTYNPEQVATEEFKAEGKQRIFGLIPNFYVSYDADAEPLSTKLKFLLALKVSVDPVTIAGVALISGAKQAADSPHYRQGLKGYGERFGATTADGFSDILIGGAILPSLLHEDPRYFYQGTGTTKSRIRHAILSPFVSKEDNGKWGPNYSSLGGDLASSALANLYYPQSNRGAGLVFGNFAIGTAERVGASLAQEFLLGRVTRRGGHMK